MSLLKLALSTIEKAKIELDGIGMTANNKEKMNREMRKNILDVIKLFSKQGHSGFSASYAIGILEKLLKHKPLTPLTGKDDEWENVSKMYGKKQYQNKRLSSVFKDGKGNSYDINGKVFIDKDGASYTSKDSKIKIKFPYTQKIEIVKVANHHCNKNICPKCGGVTTCRCSTLKTNITYKLCELCKREENYLQKYD